MNGARDAFEWIYVAGDVNGFTRFVYSPIFQERSMRILLNYFNALKRPPLGRKART